MLLLYQENQYTPRPERREGVFSDPFALTEERWRIIGLTQAGVLFVVFTERSGGVIRFISARRATRHEQNRYHRQALH